jgi:hypothetical protein
MLGLSNGGDVMYDQLTVRFYREIRGEIQWVSLVAAVVGIQGPQGRTRFEICISYVQGMVFAEPEDENDLDLDANTDFSTDSDSDTDSSNNDRNHLRKKKKRKEKKQKTERRKRKKKMKERYEKIVDERSTFQMSQLEEGVGNRLEEIRKEKEEAFKEKEEIRKEKEDGGRSRSYSDRWKNSGPWRPR